MHVIPLSVPDLTDLEENAVASCIRSSWVSSAGPDIPEFENDIAQKSSREYGIATASGTAALQLLFSSLKIKPGDKIIMPTYCFAATANAIIHHGAHPIFVDIERTNWTIDPELVEQALAIYPDVKAVIGVDVLNNIPDFKRLKELTTQFNCYLIEDAAGSLGTETAHGRGGSFGDAAIFSFNGNKIVTTGGGGMIVTNDLQLTNYARHLCAQARVGNEYIHDDLGHNYRMPNLNAALGRAQISRLDKMLNRRKEIFAAYEKIASDNPFFQLQPLAYGTKTNGWLTSFLFKSTDYARQFIEYMTEEKIVTRRFWHPLHAQIPYQEYDALLSGVAEDIATRVVSLPCSSNLNSNDLDRILHSIYEWTASLSS